MPGGQINDPSMGSLLFFSLPSDNLIRLCRTLQVSSTLHQVLLDELQEKGYCLQVFLTKVPGQCQKQLTQTLIVCL